MQPQPGLVTELLRSLQSGDQEVFSRLVEMVYGELHGIARARMQAEGAGHTLTPTALVHEVYIRFSGAGNLSFENRAHFLAVAGRAMRRVLIDHARSRQAARRGGAIEREHFDALQIAGPEPDEQLLVLNAALERLEALSSRQCQVVELRYFAGLSEEETAEVLGVSRRTVDRDWKLARAWLHAQIIA